MTDYKFFEETATGRFYKVYKDGVEVSQHYTEREAIESAQEVKFQYWDSEVKYVHEYEVNVGLTDAGITEAKDYGTPVDAPPTITSTPSPSFTVNGVEQTYDMTQHVSDDGVSAVTYGLTNVLPNGLDFSATTGILTYDGIEGASVSQHQLTATDAVDTATSNTFDITITTSAVVTTFALTDSSAGANRAVTLGVPFGEGAYATGTEFVVQENDGTPIATQWNELATWRTDGSVLHGVLTFLTPDAGSNSGTYRIVTGTGQTGTAISKAEIAATAFDAVISVTVGGSTYSISADDLLDGTITPRKDYTHFAGPICSSYCVGHPLLLNGNSTAHPSLQGHFEVRAYKTTGGAVDKAYVVATLENTGCFTAISDVTGDAIVTIGGSTVKNKVSQFIGQDHRYTARGWWGTDPSIYTNHSQSYLQSTKLVPNYRNITLDAGYLSGLVQSTDWYERNVLSAAALDSGGASPELAPYPRVDAAYVISGDERAFNSMQATNDELGWMTRGAGTGTGIFCFNPRDESTGLPLNLIDNPTAAHIDRGYSSGSGIVEAKSSTSYVCKTDLAHSPAYGYTEYLVTAEYHLLEGMQLRASMVWVCEKPGVPDQTQRTWPRKFGPAGQVRSLAWGFRHIIDADVCTPDAHPMKSFYEQSAQYAIASLNADGRPLDAADATGLWLTGPATATAIIYPPSSTPNPNDSLSGGGLYTGLAHWQDDFLTWSVGSAYQRGWNTEMDASGLWSWKAQAVVGRFGATTAGYCWDQASAKEMGICDTPTSSLYTTWAQIFDKNYPAQQSCLVSGSAFNSPDRSSSDYGAQIGPALALSVDLSQTGASAAWSLYDARDVSAWAYTYEERPEWAIEPASVALPSWYPSVGAIVELSDGTTIGSVIRADVPVDYGTGAPGVGAGFPTDYDDIVDPYSGGALIYLSGQPYLAVYGGGHGDCAYNGIVKFGPLSGFGSDTPTWSLHLAASDESAVRNDWTYTDGRQTSVHSYNNLVGVDDTLYCLSTDGNFSTGSLITYGYKFTSAGQTPIADRGGSTQVSGADYYADNIYYFGKNSGAWGQLYQYNIAGDSWSTEAGGADILTTGDRIDIAVDTTRGAALAVAQNQATYYTLPDMTRTTGKNVPAGWTGAGALEYDPNRDAFISYQTGSATVRELDAASLSSGGNPSWTTRTFTGTPPTPSPGQVAVYGRFRYVPELKGFIVVESSEGSVYFYRSA